MSMDTKTYTIKLTRTELDTMETALMIARECRADDGEILLKRYHGLDSLIEKVQKVRPMVKMKN